MDDLNARVAELEAKLCFSEDLLDEVNRTVYRQQQQIDLLQRQLQALREHVLAALPPEPRNLRDEIPPHY